MGPEDPALDRPELAKSLRAMSALLLSQESLDAILNLLIRLARESVSSVDDVSISLTKSGHFETTHASSGDVKEADHAQYASGRGPCVQATTSGQVVETALADDARRWPEFAEKALSQGYTAVLSVPLTAGEHTMGALNLYSRRADRFEPDARTVAQTFGAQAAIVCANAIAFAAAGLVQAQLEEALVSRDLIGQAKGILMARQKCDAEEAFDILRRASQRTNRKLRDVAREMVDSVVGGQNPA